MKEKYISELHNDHKEWSTQLNFAKDEIQSFNNRLMEVVRSNTKQEVLAPLEQFQNQFIREKEVIDQLLHDINEDENRIVNNAKENNVATDHRKLEVNQDLEDRMSRFNEIFDEMKSNFNKYLSEVL
ncbi:hypothetical protein GYB22_11325 [bacterium]|nr:hypothetical protein [bacterium]